VNELGRYRVIRRHRGHDPGTVFEGLLDRHQRAVARGSLELLAVVPNDLVGNSYRLPAGWAEPRKEGNDG
jgi:hypothetical protein